MRYLGKENRWALWSHFRWALGGSVWTVKVWIDSYGRKITNGALGLTSKLVYESRKRIQLQCFFYDRCWCFFFFFSLLDSDNYIKDSSSMKNIFLILIGQVLFFCYELFKVKWTSNLDTCIEHVFLCCLAMMVSMKYLYCVWL